MTRSRAARLWRAQVGSALVLVLWAPAAFADTATATVATTTASAALDLDPAELAEITAALGADAAGAPPAPSTRDAVISAVQTLIPDLAFTLDVAAALFSADENLQSGGHDPTGNGFNLQQLELSFRSTVDPYFALQGNIVFAQFGVELEEAYATTLALPARLQLRVGQFLTRFGRINATHPHTWDFVDQPFALGRVFGGEGNRGLGAEMSWLAPLPWSVTVFASSTMANGEGTARSFYGPDDLGVHSPLDLENLVTVEQFFPFDEDLSILIDASVATGPNGSGRDTRSDVYGVAAYLRYRPVSYETPLVLTLQTEWLYRRRQVPRDLLQDLSSYTQIMLRFAARWAVAARYELGTPATGTQASADPAADPLDPQWRSARHRVTANLTFWPTEFSRVRAQGSVDVPTWQDAPIWAAFLAVEFNIGAHGAHAF